MGVNEKYIKKCLKLASKGFGAVSPNPMVGCVIVCKGKVIGEGYHEKYGGPHAEINAFKSVKNKGALKGATLYVSLEPCAHHGKTPPCADAIIKYGIKKVVIGSVDPNPLVKGKGIAKLMQAGCDITVGVLEKECMDLNKRFFTFQIENRPYIILKWAMTKDEFIDKRRQSGAPPLKITSGLADKLSHTWRSEEQAIMVGTNTAIMDNPTLTTRKVKGRSPIRIVMDKNLRIPADSNIFNNFASAIVLNSKINKKEENREFVKVQFNGNKLDSAMAALYRRNIQSVIVEGGAELLGSFIEQGLWDEARVFVSNTEIGTGIKAPRFDSVARKKTKIGKDTLVYYVRK